jgi:protein-S-isoprenylcysteine O-methyltransferase Ste14
MSPTSNHPLDLRIPPLAVLALVGGIMWLCARTVPAAGFQVPARPAVSLALAAVGVGVAVAGVVSFRLARTTVNPLKPEAASSLVVSGIYRVTRNPMYLGALIVLIAWAVFLANALALLAAAAFVLYLNRFQIMPEEKALTTRFGPEFSAYCAKVRRWI